MSETTEPETTTPAPEPKTYAKGAIAAMESRFSTTASKGGAAKTIERRKYSVEVKRNLCEPNAFDDDILVGLEGLSARDELEAYKKASDGNSAGLEMAKRSIRTLNGELLKGFQRDLLWDLLGMAGRVVVMNAYMTQCTGATDADLGKSLGVTED